MISRRAAISRINRKLKGETLKKARHLQNKSVTGEYFTVNNESGELVRSHINLEEFAKEVGAIRPDESIEDK